MNPILKTTSTSTPIQLNIELDKVYTDVTLILRNELGQIVLEKQINNVKETTVDLSGMAKGVYSLSTQIDGEIIIQNVIKK